MDQLDHERPLRSPHLTARVVDGEAVLVDPAANRVLMLNPSGSRIWQLADGTRTPGEIAQQLAKEFAVSLPLARRSVDRFLSQLAEKKLLARP